MNNKKYTLIFLIFLTTNAFSQEETGVSYSSQKTTEELTYTPELSSISSFEIILNENNEEITTEMRLEMNKYRRYDVDVNWQIKEGLVVRLFPFNH